MIVGLGEIKIKFLKYFKIGSSNTENTIMIFFCFLIFPAFYTGDKKCRYIIIVKAHNRQGFTKSTDFSVVVSACAVAAVYGEYLLKADYQHHPPELVTMSPCEDILDHHDNSLLDDDYLDHER